MRVAPKLDALTGLRFFAAFAIAFIIRVGLS
jgi:hypothetical protein